MSGILGVIDPRQTLDPDRRLNAMAERMSHHDDYRRDLWSDAAAGVGLGRLGIGILNAEPQPVVNARGDVVLFVVGEFFEWEGAPAAQHAGPDA